VAFSRDGKQVVTVGHTGIVKIWDVSSGETLRSFKGSPANAVAIHPKQKYVAAGGMDGQVRLWDPASGDEIHLALCHRGSRHLLDERWAEPNLRQVPTDPIESVSFSADGKYLATASLGEVIVWDAKSFKKCHTFGRLTGRIWSVAFSPDGKRLAAATGYKGKGQIKIWDASFWEK
jgi:WD40 repeat protein